MLLLGFRRVSTPVAQRGFRNRLGFERGNARDEGGDVGLG